MVSICDCEGHLSVRTYTGITLDIANDSCAKMVSQIMIAMGWSGSQSGQMKKKTGTEEAPKCSHVGACVEQDRGDELNGR